MCRGVIKRKTRLPAHVDLAVHYYYYQGLHCYLCHGDDLCFHGKWKKGRMLLVRSELEMEMRLKGRGSCRDETKGSKEAAGGGREMFQVVVSRIPPRGDVRATQEGVSCLTSRLEPTSLRETGGRPRCRVCPVARGGLPGHFPGCAVANSIALWRICLYRAAWNCRSERQEENDNGLVCSSRSSVVNFAFHGAQCGFWSPLATLVGT
jgi:hypothetical protein